MICDDVSALGVNAAFLAIKNLDKKFYDDLLKYKIKSFYEYFLKNYSQKDLDNDKNIIGYRNLHNIVSVNDKNLIASPESLIKQLFKNKSLKSINNFVDTYNYIAIKNRVSLGAHDLECINGNVRLCLTKGDELFIPLGKKKSQSVGNGEYCYIDDDNEIICRLDCRQCDKTKITANTNSCLFIIQGHENISLMSLEHTAMELQNIFSLETSTSILNIC